jgi:hypothetical protein
MVPLDSIFPKDSRDSKFANFGLAELEI